MTNRARRIFAVGIASLFMGGLAVAKDNGKGHGHDQHENKHEEKHEQHQKVRPGAYFNDQHRVVVHQYYSEHYGGHKKCPPGLAKKNNGCTPPGHVHNWAVGQPVPVGVPIYSVPQPVLVQLPPAPYGYRYGRVGGDIVLMYRKNNMVVDIIVGL